MLKKFRTAVAVAALAGAALLGGCAGGQADAPDFVGDWTLTEIQGEESAGVEEIAMLEELGMSIVLEVHESGKATLGIADEQMDGTWEGNGDSAVFTFEGEDAQATVAGEQLTLSQDGSSMIFTKGKALSSERSDVDEESEVVNEKTDVEE